ncbi:histidine phosphatase family protein [Microbacterium sp. Mu-80]|uniref:Histidine phosphatase family protein n=1 Tax=Microbacterium bandirmense TaxID=3122050 RepID=A0ABU8LB11_9MICO
MDRLLLVRHAQATGHGHADPALSAAGELQARQLAARLSGEPVARVLSSPRLRAQQTSSAIGRSCGLAPEIVPMIDDLTPMPSAERWTDYPEHRWEWLHDTPPEERDENGVALQTAWTVLSEMITGATPGTLVVVTHAFVIGSFVSAALAAPPSAWMLLPVENTGVTEMQRRSNGELAVLRFNDTCHLEPART